MNFVIVYKTALERGGLLLNGYYVDLDFPTFEEFSEFAPFMARFDAQWSGNQTSVICVVSVPAGGGQTFPRDLGRAWAPAPNTLRGARMIAAPLPWRWTLAVSWYCPNKVRATHIYHDSISREMVNYNEKGDAVLRFPGDAHELETARYGPMSHDIPDFVRVGVDSPLPGQAMFHVKPRDIVPVGVSVRNKERRSQAKLFNQALDFQSKIAYGIQSAAFQIESLREVIAGNTGHWIGVRLRSIVNDLMGDVVALAQAHKDNNVGASGGKMNQGAGWNVRFGPTGASIEAQYDFLKKQQEDDQKFLQKFPAKTDVSGDEYFENSDAMEWIKVGREWSDRVGGFGLFDFLNTDQQDIKDDSRLDNFTPLYPDLPFKVDGLPRPQKNPERKIALPGLDV